MACAVEPDQEPFSTEHTREARMTDKLHDPKTQGPEHKHQEPYQQDMNPEAAAGQNFGLIGPHPEKDNPRTAFDVKEAHRQLVGWTDDDLKQIPILPAGSRLEQGAKFRFQTRP